MHTNEHEYTFWLPIRVYSCAFAASLLLIPVQAQIGVFTNHADVGTVLHAGSADYDASAHSYTIGGSGENMWFATDDFQYVWKKMSGDVTLTARVSIPDKEGDAHRKAVLMIRQSLEPDAAYADVALHGDGLTSLQFRAAKGEVTHEIESNVSAPKRLRIEKRGDSLYMWIGGEGDELRFAGGSMRVPLEGPFYVGIGVCAHNKDEFRKAVFSDVELTAPAAAGKPVPWSTLETISVASTDARVSYTAPGSMQSPNWSPDGLSLLFYRDGRTEKVAAAGGKPEAMASPGIREAPGMTAWPSPDGQKVALLLWQPGEDEVALQVRSVSDGKVTTLCRYTGGHGVDDAPAWSPDGLRLAFISHQLVR